MTQVKILAELSYPFLEEKINNWLSKNKSIKVIDIKLQTIINPSTNSEMYNAMIVYESN
jgi:hypothetical protein